VAHQELGNQEEREELLIEGATAGIGQELLEEKLAELAMAWVELLKENIKINKRT